MKKTILLLIVVFAAISLFGQTGKTRVISGQIIESNGSPVAFATITVENTKNAVSADANGRFSMRIDTAKVFTILIQAAGYKNAKFQFDKQTTAKIVLERSAQQLTEVVVTTGFGRIRQKSSIGYAATTVGGLQPSPSSNGWSGENEDHDREGYSNIEENGFRKVSDNPLSTFSIDVDAASYSNVRRFLNDGLLPPAGAVRIEEMINYFNYQYPAPANGQPFSINTETTICPWNPQNRLVKIGLQGKRIAMENLPPSNLVFLIDVSGSMSSENKLPLVKASLKLLTDQLRKQDRISIVVYAGNAGLVLPATSGTDKITIKSAIDALEAGGSTAGGKGIELAYKIALQNLMPKGNNRVILCTDGDFNVGASSDDEMVRLIEKERKTGVFLTVLGYGMGNYQDSKMQQLADKGNGNHAYIDGLSEAKKVLVNEFGGTLFAIAKDVKLQVEFNPAQIEGYRLIGYENRMLSKEDFNDDKKDAGELGSGHTVTAFYEIIPAGTNSPFLKSVDSLKYQVPVKTNYSGSDELLTVKFRYKEPQDTVSKLISVAVKDKGIAFENASADFRFATAVASLGMLLRNSEFKGSSNYDQVYKTASAALENDKEGYKKEFVSLVTKAAKIAAAKAK